ncbi:MAG TPA: prepilin-type N-terminal cleavage/methylation domain-containing protein [Planctomycetota bacterium]|nr:prepilin-type N-terminal cleavage/methylation domain-containing protein [Planctomycetota bacterium]
MVEPRPGRRSGFTLIEVLIAMFILSVGIVGVLALHTATVVNASKIAQESYVSNLARSIDAAIAEGVRQRSFILQENWGVARGFLLRHDGVPTPAGPAMPPLPTSLNDGAGTLIAPLAASDYSIFMPNAANPDPVFVFPRPNGAAAENPNGGSKGTDDWNTAGVPGYNGLVYLTVKRVYQLPYVAPSGNNAGASNPSIDAGGQYGFAISVRRAQSPALAVGGPESFAISGPGPTVLPQTNSPRTDGLYEVEIHIYRAFDPNPKSPQHVEVRNFRTLLAVGP